MTQSFPSLSTLLVKEANFKLGTALLLENAIRELVRDEIYGILEEQENAKQRDDELVARIVQGVRQEMVAGTPTMSLLIEPTLRRVVSEVGGGIQREVIEKILTEMRART